MAMEEDENLSNARRVGLVVVLQLNSLSLDQPPPPQQPCPPLLLARTRCWQMALQARESVELVARVREEGTRSRQARDVSWQQFTAVSPCSLFTVPCSLFPVHCSGSLKISFILPFIH